MMELINLIVLAALASMMLLRKVNIISAVLTDNAASFVNQTADRLHLRKLVGRCRNVSGGGTVGDAARSSIDEIPVAQDGVNDSRAHIAVIQSQVAGGTGAVEATSDNVVLTFERNQLFLDPDEAWFMNNVDVSGAMPISFAWNFWYED